MLQNVSDTPANTDNQALLWNASLSTYVPQIIDVSDISGTAAFSITSHTHNYLPLSGGTITGSLSAASISSFIYGTDGMVFEVRTDDPVSPIQGQV